MNSSTATPSAARAASIHPATTLGRVTLAVADADRSIRFYRDLLGLQVLAAETGRVVLGAGATPLIELQVQPGLAPRPRRTTGLYHVAILLPTRRDLAFVLKRLLGTRHPFGASDHLVSEALYVSDPDNNGLEIYRDRPRAEWRYAADGSLMMDTLHLNAPAILAELGPDGAAWPGMPAGTVIGHMHLQVGDLDQAEAFYSGVLGFDVMVRGYPGALFVSAGGYHHHLGLNTWESAGAPRPPASAAGLRSFAVVLPDAAALEAVRQRVVAAGLPLRDAPGGLAVEDPWGNVVLLQVGAAA